MPNNTDTNQINVLWLYADVLNLHGDRGNLMAWQHVADQLSLPLSIERLDDLSHAPDFADKDIVFLCPGEVKNMSRIVSALSNVRPALERFLNEGGYLFATSNSGALLAEKTLRHDNSEFSGLGLLPMTCQERKQVYGDDLWCKTAAGMELIGNQIQVLDTHLHSDALPFAEVIYGHGNNNAADEGCRRDNIIFSNMLGPMLVKNPRFAATVLADIAERRGLEIETPLLDTEYEDKSFALIRSFIEKKMA